MFISYKLCKMYWPLENFKIQLQLMHKLFFFLLKCEKRTSGRWGEGKAVYGISTSCLGKAERVSLGRSPRTEPDPKSLASGTRNNGILNSQIHIYYLLDYLLFFH